MHFNVNNITNNICYNIDRSCAIDKVLHVSPNGTHTSTTYLRSKPHHSPIYFYSLSLLHPGQPRVIRMLLVTSRDRIVAHHSGLMCYTGGVTWVVLHAWCYMGGVIREVLHAWCYMSGVARKVLYERCYTIGININYACIKGSRQATDYEDTILIIFLISLQNLVIIRISRSNLTYNDIIY